MTTTVLNTKISEVENKIPNTSSLVTTTILNTKINEVENKIPNTSSLVTTTILNTKINEVENKITNHDKYITTPEYNKLAAENFTVRLNQANLVTTTDFNNKVTSFNRKILLNKTKYLEVQRKLSRIYFASNDRSENTFVYQPTVDTLELKNDKGINYVFSWKSTGVYSSKLKALYTPFLHSINISGCKMQIKLDKNPLAVEQNNYMTNILIVYFVYDLAASPRNSTSNFKFKNCLFGATNISKNSDK